MKAFELAECIARDASCAQGEFNGRVLSIVPYLSGPDEEIARLRTAIFNTINDLDKKKPNIKAMRNYLAGVYNAPR